MLVEILSRFAKAGLTDHFTVVGTHALYAYEAAAGVRFMVDAMTTRLSFVTQVDRLDVLNLLQKADHTFAIRKDQGCTAVNSRGFEVEIISGLQGTNRTTAEREWIFRDGGCKHRSHGADEHDSSAVVGG